MAELLKNAFSKDFFEKLSKALDQVLESFNKEQFLLGVFDNEWEQRELKERMRHVSTILKLHLSDNFSKGAQQILEILSILQVTVIDKENPMSGLGLMIVPDYIECNGINDFETSVNAMEHITQVISCEFAIRPFIIKYEDKMLPIMLAWASHKNEHIRRLASEGCRPRLPWAMALPALKNDPTAILPILETLKNDPSEYVRRSVANNLNDISKDNLEVVIALTKQWKGKTENTDKLLKHACRSLLKDGHQEVLRIFGFGAVEDVAVADYRIINDKVKIGGSLNFCFELQNNSHKSEMLRLEYGLYYLKQNGSLSRKVFKISEKEYAANSLTKIDRKQSFKIISTRKFHAGNHQVSLIINGVEFDLLDFELVE